MLFRSHFAFIILFFICSQKTYAVQRDFILKLAQDTIALSENTNREEQAEAEKNLAKIRELLQSELKSGKKDAPIDVYLFLSGTLNSDILSLQSLLVSSHKKNFPKDLAQLISQSSAKKLSYATKENRIAQKTNISVKNISTEKNCQLYVNGYHFAQTDFVSPAGVPLYIALYCEGNSFAIQKIQPEETQKNLRVTFSEFKKITFSAEKIENDLPNPNARVISDLPVRAEESSPGAVLSSSGLTGGSKQIPVGPPVKPEGDKDTPEGNKTAPEGDKGFFAIGTGVAITQGLGEYSGQYLSNLNLQDGAFVSSSSWLSYQNMIFSFEAAQISFLASNQNKNATYIKPAIGYTAQIAQTEHLKLKNDTLLYSVTLINGPENNSGFGLQNSIGPDFDIGADGFLLNSRASLAYSFGTLSGFQFSFFSGIGFEF